jgi:predicted Rossmann fold nucleotide-binding protein DprA/Smf involved in DNA uptake
VVQPILLGQQVALAELVACLAAAALVAVAALRLGMLATAQQAELL